MANFSRVLKKIDLYSKEIAFAAGCPCSLAERARLIRLTILDHLRNWGGHLPDDLDTEISVSVQVGEKSQAICLRPHGGDLVILYDIFLRGAYAVSPADLDPMAVRIVIDAGAHIGLASLAFAGRYPNAQILSVEPHPRNFDLLVRNTKREQRITPIHACLVGRPSAGAYIGLEGGAYNASMTDQASGTFVPAITIEELCQRYGISEIDLLKLDIEGGEREVAGNSTSFASRTRAIVAELHGNYGLAELRGDLAPVQFDFRQQLLPDGWHLVAAFRL